MDFEEESKKEEIAWRQRSRIQWLKSGDKNTKFFHRVTIRVCIKKHKNGDLISSSRYSNYIQWRSEWLQRNFKEEEVWDNIKSCATDKAPGPDGFNMNFFQTLWEVIKGDIMGTMQYFHDHQVFERSLNAIYVALIPKKTGAVELRYFRPISLISGIYKIMLKC